MTIEIRKSLTKPTPTFHKTHTTTNRIHPRVKTQTFKSRRLNPFQLAHFYRSFTQLPVTLLSFFPLPKRQTQTKVQCQNNIERQRQNSPISNGTLIQSDFPKILVNWSNSRENQRYIERDCLIKALNRINFKKSEPSVGGIRNWKLLMNRE